MKTNDNGFLRRRLRLLVFAAFIVVLGAGAAALTSLRDAEAKFRPIRLLERALTAEALVRGEIVALEEETFTLAIRHVVFGTAVAKGGEVRVGRFQDWPCAVRGDAYETGQELYVFLSSRGGGEGAGTGAGGGAWTSLGAGCEGEARVVAGIGYILFAPGDASASASGGRVRGSAWAVADADAALATARDLFAWDGERAILRDGRQADLAAARNGPNALLRALCEEGAGAAGPALLGPAERAAAAPIAFIARATKARAKVGEPLPVEFRIRNVSDAAVLVLPSLDASDVGWRYPKYAIEVRDESGAVVPVEPGGRCGNVNQLAAGDFVELAPGGEVDPFGEGTFGHYALAWCPSRPGRYTIRCVYDVSGDGDGRDGWRTSKAGPPDAAAHARLEKLLRGRFQSNEVAIVVEE